MSSHPQIVDGDDLYAASTDKGGDVMYVKARRQAKWMYKILNGDNGLKSTLENSKILEQLLKKFRAACDGEPANPTVVDAPEVVDLESTATSASTVVGAPGVDKMAALDRALEWGAQGPSKRTKTGPPSKAGGADKRWHRTGGFKAVQVLMPERFSSAVAGQRLVRLIGTVNNTQTVYIHQGDFTWLLEYMHEELVCAGVPGLDDVGTGDSQEITVSDSKTHNLEWNFQTGEWEATFLVGPLKGRKARCDPSTFTKDKFLHAMRGRPTPVQWEGASRAEKREAMKQFLIQSVEAAILAQNGA